MTYDYIHVTDVSTINSGHNSVRDVVFGLWTAVGYKILTSEICKTITTLSTRSGDSAATRVCSLNSVNCELSTIL